MTERPILFNAEMVRAILDGRKTVTRRSVRLPRARDSFVVLDHGGGWWPYQSDDGESELCTDGMEHPYTCPYGKPGDRLWVRETWCDVNLSGAPGIAFRADGDVRDLMDEPSFINDGVFNYDDERVKPYSFAVWSEDLMGGVEGRWRPSIHMPRWASRILLEVTDVRVERLHEITIGQICKEGLARSMYEFIPVTTAFDVFAELWNSTGGDWDANPWVWVIEFKRIES